MILTFKPAAPIAENVKKMVEELNKCEGTKASYEFIKIVPRHYLVTIEIDDSETHQSVFVLGALIGAFDNYNIH